MKTSYTRSLLGTSAAFGLAMAMALSAWGGMREDFQNLKMDSRRNTGPLFWMHGSETKAELEAKVDVVAASGQGMLSPESRPHSDWLGEGWWRDLGIVINRAKLDQLKVMLFDDYWWPSQSMGGKVPIPEKYRSLQVNSAVYETGKEPRAKEAGEIARVRATEKDGLWTLDPQGGRTVVFTVSEQGNRSQARFPTVNGLDSEAVDWFLEKVYQPHYDHFKDDFADGTIFAFFFDEPETQSWWGPDFAAELAARGENVGELLLALKFKWADAAAQARARYRYDDARAEVWSRTLYGRQSKWCRDHGVFSSGHFMEHDTCYYDYSMSGGDVMHVMKYVDVPGVDLVCHQYYPNSRSTARLAVAHGQMPKIGSSVSHVQNRHGGTNWCEIFGGYDQVLTYSEMKWLCDWHQVRGCNMLIPHSFNPKSPYDGDYPPYFHNGGREPRFPLFHVWADYNNRCALMLTGGEHQCPIAQVVPGLTAHAGKYERPEMFTFAVQDAQLDCDWLGLYDLEEAKIVAKTAQGGPWLQTARGTEHYEVLALPAVEMMPFGALEKALAFAQAGGKVIGYGLKPSDTPTKGKTAADVKRAVEALYAQPTAVFLSGAVNGASLRAALDGKLGLKRSFAVAGLSDQERENLHVLVREKEGATIYFVCNQNIDGPRKFLFTPEAKGGAPELWRAMSGEIVRADVDASGAIPLQLEAYESVFVVVPAKPTAGLRGVAATSVATLPLTVKETVTPVAKPAASPLEGAAWLWHPEARDAKGKITLRATLKLPAAAKAGEVAFTCDNSAAISINGSAPMVDNGEMEGWRQLKTVKGLERLLQAGDNQILVVADNFLTGFAGFIAKFSVECANGANVELATDAAQWEASLDGQTFKPALKIGDYGCSPWNRVVDNVGPYATSPVKESVVAEGAFELASLKAGERVVVSCAEVAIEPAARITVNGRYVGGFIGKPFELDVTAAVHPGANSLRVEPFRVSGLKVEIRR